MAFVRVPNGHGRVELSTFHTPAATGSAPRAPVNTPGIPRLTFVVDAVDDVLDRLRPHGAELVGEVAQYEDINRYCYVRGPAGIIIGLVEELR
jgi:catechol 2,3-dioxygenase-like lactoylglutathione lyase family enzyme